MVNRIELLFAKRDLTWLSIGMKIEMPYALRHAPWEYGRDIAKEDLEYVIVHSD